MSEYYIDTNKIASKGRQKKLDVCQTSEIHTKSHVEFFFFKYDFALCLHALSVLKKKVKMSKNFTSLLHVQVDKSNEMRRAATEEL